MSKGFYWFYRQRLLLCVCFFRLLCEKRDFKNQSESVPLGNGSSPEEVSRALEFILEAFSFTGQMITLDGGEHLDWIRSEDKSYKD